jgi:hypothetical protein
MVLNRCFTANDLHFCHKEGSSKPTGVETEWKTSTDDVNSLSKNVNIRVENKIFISRYCAGWRG